MFCVQRVSVGRLALQRRQIRSDSDETRNASFVPYAERAFSGQTAPLDFMTRNSVRHSMGFATFTSAPSETEEVRNPSRTPVRTITCPGSEKCSARPTSETASVTRRFAMTVVPHQLAVPPDGVVRLCVPNEYTAANCQRSDALYCAIRSWYTRSCRRAESGAALPTKPSYVNVSFGVAAKSNRTPAAGGVL